MDKLKNLLDESFELRYRDEVELQRAMLDYVADCRDDGRPLTMSGLANAIGISRTTLANYSKDRTYYRTILTFRNMVEQYAEEQLFRSGGQVAGVIFNLKNNHGWVDQTQSEVTNTHIHLHGVAKASYQEADKLDAQKVESAQIPGPADRIEGPKPTETTREGTPAAPMVL